MTTGIIVARFQIDTLHKGQRTLVDTVIKNHERVIIFLGVTPVMGRKNALDYRNREMMIKTLYSNVEVYPLYDHKSNEDWVTSLEGIIEELVSDKDVILYGSRDSCINTYIKYGGKLPSIIIPSDENYNATEIREQIAKEYINSDDFRKGIIWGQYNNNYPTAFGTVDVICTRIYRGELEILLGQKSYEVGRKLWRIPGGFVDPSDNFGRETASRELKEETCIHASPSIFEIIEQVRIDDWRYIGTENSIMTTIYSGHIGDGWHDKVICREAKASDDLANVQWFKLTELNLEEGVVKEHRKCIRIFTEHPHFQNLLKELPKKQTI